MFGGTTTRQITYFAAGLLIFSTGAATYWFYDRDRSDTATSDALTRSFLNIERSIGFAGFIHNFKNHVLRPDNPDYAKHARDSYQLATVEIARLQSILNQAEIHVDLSGLQNTLSQYNDAIDEISKGHLLGIPVTEIDRTFLAQDKVAASILAQLQLQIERLLKKRQRSTAKWGWLSFLLFLILIFSLAYGWYEHQRKNQRKRKYLRQQQEVEQSRKHAAEMNSLVQELERSNRELDGFAYTASHDLKEPMRGIAINANFLARENLSENGKKRVDRMLVLTTKMDQLISDILFFSRLGRGDKKKEKLDPIHVINGIEAELREWVEENSGEIKITGELPWIHAERTKVKTVFQNLIVNGLKYNDAKQKTVDISFHPQAEVNADVLRNVFCVRDNGIGIAKNNQDRMFRIFSRLNREEEYGAGTGAGLSFVRKIIESYGYQITLTSQIGTGTVFYFSLPLADTSRSRTNQHDE